MPGVNMVENELAKFAATFNLKQIRASGVGKKVRVSSADFVVDLYDLERCLARCEDYGKAIYDRGFEGWHPESEQFFDSRNKKMTLHVSLGRRDDTDLYMSLAVSGLGDRGIENLKKPLDGLAIVKDNRTHHFYSNASDALNLKLIELPKNNFTVRAYYS